MTSATKNGSSDLAADRNRFRPSGGTSAPPHLDGVGQVDVVILDKSELIRAGLRAGLVPFGIRVASEAADLDEGVRLAIELSPDVVVTDLNLRVGSGLEVTRRLSVLAPTSPVIILTNSTDHQDLTWAVMAGAQGYMLKDARTEAIAGAIHAVATGHTVVSSSVAGHLFHGVRAGRHKPGTNGTVNLRDRLTDRELEILKQLASGRDNSQIGVRMNLSPSTVKNHISSILTKLGLKNRIQAAVFAVRHGVV
jgi:DNA-binding NarL/FixJ family response regulator